MGTTLHAQVEILEPAVPEFRVPARWRAVSVWQLGKDYEAMTALDAGAGECLIDGDLVVTQGLPSDVDLLRSEIALRERAQTVDGRDLDLLTPELPHYCWRSLVASVQPLLPLSAVRVVFWRR